MAIQFTDFSRAPLLDAPGKDIFENVLKGYQMSQEPAKMQQEMEYKKALMQKALQPQVPKGALADAFQIRKGLDPNSPTYERDLGEVNNYIKKLGTSSNGVQISSSPEGGFEVSVGGSGQNALIPGFPKLKQGEVPLYDDNKKPIGIGKPYTEGEKKEASGRAAFNIWQKFITDAQAPYSGKGATRQFESDVQNYSTDENAKTRIDKLLAADNLLFSATVKEEATLGGANTNQAYNRITHSLENSEIYPFLRKISKYQLPQGYKKSSSDLFNQILNEGTEAGQNIPAYKPYYFNQNQKKNNSQMQGSRAPTTSTTTAKSEPKIISTSNGITTIKNGDKTLHIPNNLVDRYMNEHIKPEFGKTQYVE